MIRVLISPRAEHDLEDIWLTIAADNPAAATRILRAIGARIVVLSEHPRLGPRRPDIRPRTRILVERPYLIFYEIHPDSRTGPIDSVEIVRVIDGRRNLASLF